MAQTTTREDIRQEVRDNIQEVSGVSNAIWSDTLLNRHIVREILSLPRQGIYQEESWTQTLDADTDYSAGIPLPSGTIKAETVERNDGTSTNPHWVELKGVDNYNNNIYLPYDPSTDEEIRVKIKRSFTSPSADGVALDIDDDKCEVVVWGVTIRCYRILIGYLRNSVSWDTVTKPGDLSIPAIQSWLRDAQEYYKMLIKRYGTAPKPRDIDLTG